MSRNILSCLFVFLIFAVACFAWELEFGGSDAYNYTSAITQYMADSYVISANVFYETRNNTDILIFAVNEDGDSLWAYTFGDSLDNFASDILVKDDGSIYVCGFTYREEVSDTISNLYDAFVFKTDATGTIYWWRYYRYPGTYGHPSYPHGLTFSRIVETDDGFLVVGSKWTQSHIPAIYTTSLNDWMIHIDETGETLWEQSTPGGTLSSFAYCGDGVYKTGSTGVFSVSKYAFPVSSLWQSSFFTAPYTRSQANDIIITETGNVFAVGYEYQIPYIDSIEHLYSVGALLTPSGDSLLVGYIAPWESHVAKAVNHIDGSSRITVITSMTLSNSLGLVMLDSDATPLGLREYPVSGNFVINDACVNSHGEYVVVGYKGSLPTQAWVMKLDSVDFYSIEEDVASTPSDFQISAYPNPFNSAVAIDVPVDVSLEIFNVNGRIVDNRLSSKEGIHIWRPKPENGSGVYLVIAKYNNERLAMKSLIYLK